MAQEGKDGGDGSGSPFGDGNGAPAATGPATKGNDFMLNPRGNSRLAGNRDFSQEGNVPQKRAGGGFGHNPDTVPAGGRFPTAEPGKVSGYNVNSRKPYKLGAGGVASNGKAPMTMQSGGGTEDASGSGEAGDVPGSEG